MPQYSYDPERRGSRSLWSSFMTIGEGQIVSIEFQDNPIRVQALLVD
jgi:hypothetical protein